MKISQYIRNTIYNLPIGHYHAERVLRDLPSVLDAEERCDHVFLFRKAREYGINPIRVDVGYIEE